MFIVYLVLVLAVCFGLMMFALSVAGGNGDKDK